jgi:hypothetical protein
MNVQNNSLSYVSTEHSTVSLRGGIPDRFGDVGIYMLIQLHEVTFKRHVWLRCCDFVFDAGSMTQN